MCDMHLKKNFENRKTMKLNTKKENLICSEATPRNIVNSVF